MPWTLTDAKDNLSELVGRAATDGPQTIAVDGRDTAVVFSLNPHQNPEPKPTFKALLQALPPLDRVDLSRDPSPIPRYRALSFLLDPTAISEVTHARPDVGFMRWFDEADDRAFHLSVLTLGELRHGALKRGEGVKRRGLERFIAGMAAFHFGPTGCKLVSPWTMDAD